MWVPLNIGNLPLGEVVKHARRLVWVLEVNDEQTFPAMSMLRGEPRQRAIWSIIMSHPNQTCAATKKLLVPRFSIKTKEKLTRQGQRLDYWARYSCSRQVAQHVSTVAESWYQQMTKMK